MRVASSRSDFSGDKAMGIHLNYNGQGLGGLSPHPCAPGAEVTIFYRRILWKYETSCISCSHGTHPDHGPLSGRLWKR